MKYYENQFMCRDQPFIIPVICLISFLGWVFFIFQVVAGIHLGNHPAPDWAIWLIWIIFGIVFPAFFIILRLEIRIDNENLEFRFFPVQVSWKKIPFEQIKKTESKEFRPFRDFGGWGIRRGRLGKAYIISGNMGVQVTMKNGRTFLLGSKNAEELEAAIKKD